MISSGASVQKKASAKIDPEPLQPANPSSLSHILQGQEPPQQNESIAAAQLGNRGPVTPLQRNEQVFPGGRGSMTPVAYAPSMVGANLYVRTTAYSHKEADSLQYGRLNAAGGILQYTSTVRSAAADWSRFPLGTRFRIHGQPHEYVIDDYGRALVGTNTIDIYKPTISAMNEYGAKNVPIQIIEWGCFEKSRQILESRKNVKDADHVRQMLHDIEQRYTHGLGKPKTGYTTASAAGPSPSDRWRA